jgi:hypothetical protein
MSDEFYFNPEQQEGSDFELIPPGDYVKANMKIDRSGTHFVTSTPMSWRRTSPGEG